MHNNAYSWLNPFETKESNCSFLIWGTTNMAYFYALTKGQSFGHFWSPFIFVEHLLTWCLIMKWFFLGGSCNQTKQTIYKKANFYPPFWYCILISIFNIFKCAFQNKRSACIQLDFLPLIMNKSLILYIFYFVWILIFWNW